VPDYTDVSPDISAARDDVQRSRAQVSDTIAEIEARVTAPVRAVKERLDVGRMIQDHPWAALTTAIATGVIVAAAGADRRAASLAADAARKGAEKAREGSVAGARMAREAPSKSRSALSSMMDGIGAKVAVTVIDALREPAGTRPTPEPHSGLGFVHHDAPAHESEQEPRPLT
jgi:ElaB/YqjD/DUF883 family membrane-anchored ribosome-binding protein